MYSDKFVEELLKNIQMLAEENRRLAENEKELISEIDRLRGEPVIMIAKQLPPCPADKEGQEKWFSFAKELMKTLSSN